MHKRLRLIAAIILTLISSLFIIKCTDSSLETPEPTIQSEPPQDTPPATPQEAPQLSKTNLVTGLQLPWDLAFAPDGSLLYTEMCIGLSMRRSNGQVVHLFGNGPGALLTAPDLLCESQSAMLGLALDPDFANNRTAFVFMTSNLSSPPTNRVLRLTANADFTAVTRTDIVTDIPFKSQATDWGPVGSHSGGRVRFGPDGFLYISTGDNLLATLPQNLQSLAGKVLRVDRNGQAAPGNNTPAGGDPRIFTYGHRNVQGICFHPDTNQVYISEHGPNHSDEITLISAGGNGGWDPRPDPGVTCLADYCGYVPNNLAGIRTSMTDLNKFPNAMRPLRSEDVRRGTGPCTFLAGPQWRAWDRAMVVGIMAAADLDVLKISDAGTLEEQLTADLPEARFRSLVQGPDGNLYIATDGGEIWVVSPLP